MNNDYIQTIEVGGNATDILHLPCVEGCHKELDGSITYDVNCQNSGTARRGDLLCQKKNGLWTVERKEKGGAA